MSFYPVDPDNSTRLNKTIQALVEVIIEGFDSTNPYHGRSTGAFRSHYDWHSSVLAHWALLSIAGVVREKTLVDLVLHRLTAKELLKVREELSRTPEFECPYGQTWLLLLLAEFQKHSGDNDSEFSLVQQSLWSETTERILLWLEETPFPDGGQPSTCRGDYQSWLLTYYLFGKAAQRKGCRGKDSARRERLHLKLTGLSVLQDEMSSRAFVSPLSLFQLITDGEPSPIPSAARIGHETLIKEIQEFGEVKFENCHALGVLITKAWPLASRSKSNTKDRLKFESFLSLYLAEPRLWKTDFVTVSHWIPQYLWFAVWLSLGEP